MQFEFNSEQHLLNDSVGRFIEKEYSFEARARRLAEKQTTQPDAWRVFAENGWLAAALPERHGGLGGSVVDTAIICRQLGRGLVLEPYLGCAVLAAQTLAGAGSESQLSGWLPGIGEGSRRIALAHSEGSQGLTERVATRAESTQFGYRLTGRKTLVLGGPGADALVVSACADLGEGADVGLFLVAADASGLKIASTPLHDGQLAAEVTLDDVIGEPIGAPGEGLVALREGLTHGFVALCSELVGSMERVVEITADYLRTRKQFDVPLASLQALQHRMADMAAELELARSMLFVALAAFQNDEPARRQEVLCAAKAFISKAALNVCGQGIQLHGAIGMTEEYCLGHYFKRAVVGGLLLGTNTAHEAATTSALQNRLANTQ
jgi:alkylation response protein AidB-like acyl-CoA dehydrogenase